MSFAVPLFLLAMLAGLIPVLLHMINQQQAKSVPFGTLRFLRLGAQRTRRRKYFHDLLLLILRVAALVLIALALARPTLTQLGNLFGSSDSSAVAIILDNSASMSTVDVGGSRWEAALAATHEIMDRLDDRDSVALFLTCGPPRPALDQLYQNQEVIRQTLAECSIRYERADLAAYIRKAETMLARSAAPNKEIYVITDMQSASWESSTVSDSADANDLPLILVDVHREPLRNVSLVDVSLQSAGPLAGMPLQATVGLRGDLNLDQQRHVELLIDGKAVETSPTINVPAATTSQHSFNFAIDQPGIHQGIVRLSSEDACATDNQRYFAVSVARNIPIAVVKPDEHEIAYLDDSYYLERALSPVVGDDWAIQTDSILAAALANSALHDYAVIFCVNLPALKATIAKRLHDYVRGGGTVVWICGDNVELDPYRTMNQSTDDELLPVTLTMLREADTAEKQGWKIGWMAADHPALAALTRPQSLYKAVQVSKHFATAPIAESGAQVLVKLDDGQPLLIERKIGRGAVLLLGTSVHTDWSNLPLRPLFMPLMARLTFYLADANAAQRQLSAGSPIQITAFSPGLMNQTKQVRSHEVIRPDGDVVRVDTGEDSEGFHYTDTHEIGIYKVRSVNDVEQPEVAIAINLDPGEIAAAISSPASISRLVGEHRLVVCRDPKAIPETIRQLRQGRSLMEYFLIAVLMVLIVEAYVANRRVDQELSDERREGARRKRATGVFPVSWAS